MLIFISKPLCLLLNLQTCVIYLNTLSGIQNKPSTNSMVKTFAHQQNLLIFIFLCLVLLIFLYWMHCRVSPWSTARPRSSNKMNFKLDIAKQLLLGTDNTRLAPSRALPQSGWAAGHMLPNPFTQPHNCVTTQQTKSGAFHGEWRTEMVLLHCGSGGVER